MTVGEDICSKLSSDFEDHKTVNHSLNFVDPDDPEILKTLRHFGLHLRDLKSCRENIKEF